MNEVNWLKLRIYTIYNYLDITTKIDIDINNITSQLEEGTTIMLEKEDGNIFILNNLNVLGIEILSSKEEIPPIQK